MNFENSLHFFNKNSYFVYASVGENTEHFNSKTENIKSNEFVNKMNCKHFILLILILFVCLAKQEINLPKF